MGRHGPASPAQTRELDASLLHVDWFGESPGALDHERPSLVVGPLRAQDRDGADAWHQHRGLLPSMSRAIAPGGDPLLHRLEPLRE
eukprot:7392964-Heterocapsa_arctica.AAC.1